MGKGVRWVRGREGIITSASILCIGAAVGGGMFSGEDAGGYRRSR